MKLKKIVFPTDFSHCGDEALELAATLARESGAEIHIVHVEEPPMAYGNSHMYYGPVEPTAAQLSELLHKVAPNDDSITVHHHMLMGDPSSEVIEYADRQNADMIVIGTHGRTGLFHLLMGSVAEKIVRHAKCPVVTMRHPKHADKTTSQ